LLENIENFCELSVMLITQTFSSLYLGFWVHAGYLFA